MGLLTPEEEVERDRVRFRTRSALANPRPLVRDRHLALAMSWLVAQFGDDITFEDGTLVCDWCAIPVARPDDVRGDEPATCVALSTQLDNGRQPRACDLTSSRRSPRYVAALLTGCYDDVVNAEAGERNNVLNAAAYRVGRAVATGLLDEMHAERALAEAAALCGLPQREAATTIRHGLRAGEQHPLEK
jgi:hypothetical protein